MKFLHTPLRLLDAAQQDIVLAAIRTKVPVIIDGDRSKPTGKSALCDYLKSLGADACEAWELEEGLKKPDNGGMKNQVSVVIRLNRGLVTLDGLG